MRLFAFTLLENSEEKEDILVSDSFKISSVDMQFFCHERSDQLHDDL
jgi:hypothetical protein